MFLQGAKGVLKNRTIGADAQSFQQFAQVSGLLTFDTKQMGDSIEEKRRLRPTLQFPRRQFCSCHQKSPDPAGSACAPQRLMSAKARCPGGHTFGPTRVRALDDNSFHWMRAENGPLVEAGTMIEVSADPSCGVPVLGRRADGLGALAEETANKKERLRRGSSIPGSLAPLPARHGCCQGEGRAYGQKRWPLPATPER